MSIQEGAPPSSTADQERDALLRQTELLISNVLRGGVLLSAGIIIVGVVMFYVRYYAPGHSGGVSAFPHSFGAVISGATQGDPLSVIAFGLLVLLITPVMRVAVSIIAFGVERDWLYVVITTIVLIILIISFLLGKGGA